MFKAEICVIDGTVGDNYLELGGDPVYSSILIVGNNPVATDATGARFMGVNPKTQRGTPPFLRADNHIGLAAELGLGSVNSADINLIGEIPSGRKPFTIEGATESETFVTAERGRRKVCRLAQKFFENRDYFVRQYLDQAILLGKDGILYHTPIREFNSRAMFQALGDAPYKGYEVFAKLVQAEEAELSTPYRL